MKKYFVVKASIISYNDSVLCASEHYRGFYFAALSADDINRSKNVVRFRDEACALNFIAKYKVKYNYPLPLQAQAV